MQTSEFIEKVKRRTGTENEQQARLYITAVFGALRDRISAGGAHNLSQQLPEGLKEMWDAGPLHEVVKSVTGIEHLTLNEFLGKVQNSAHLADGREAERIITAVFNTLKEQITDGEIQAVAHQLPQDLKELWAGGMYTSRRAIGPAAAEVFRSDEQLKDEITELLRINDDVDESFIDVEVHNGSVLLKGTVCSETEKTAAERAAREALGVTEVKNELNVENQQSFCE